MRVLLTGANTDLGRRVSARLAENGVSVVAAGLTATAAELRGVDVVVHLSAGDHDALAARQTNAIAGLPEFLDHLGESGVRQLVLLSSAMVYGAWPNNPVPLTEDSAVRPDASFTFAHQLAQVEELVDAWGHGNEQRRVAVLRPVLWVASSNPSSVVRALAAGMGHRFGEDDAPAQFLHVDDLVEAVGRAVSCGLDGVFNIAPDHWVTGERVRALSGQGPRIKVPDRVSDVIAHLSWRFQRGPLPPGLMPYLRHPWLVSNDRIRQTGWEPSVTNEQAYVEATEERWWTMLTPKRKQELALGAMVLAVIGAMVAVIGAVRRSRRA